MRRGYLVIVAAFSLAISMGAAATAQEPPGHLPPGSQNVNLVSRLQLTDTPAQLLTSGTSRDMRI